MGRSPALIALGTLAWLLSSACYGPPRPQLLVEVTTDLATPADVAADPSILGTATIDHVRAEVLADDGTTLTAKDFAIASGAEFPVSFGIEATEGAPLLVRVTGYRSTLADAFQWLYSFDKLAPQEHIRGILGRLLFSGEAALKPVEALSGGECARLLLAKLLVLKHNVLVLDEPTNHLDIESIEGLLDGIELFKGTVIFVSHDRHFVSKLATRIVELRAKPGDHGAEIVDYGGTYDEFLEKAGTDYIRKQ